MLRDSLFRPFSDARCAKHRAMPTMPRLHQLLASTARLFVPVDYSPGPSWPNRCCPEPPSVRANPPNSLLTDDPLSTTSLTNPHQASLSQRCSLLSLAPLPSGTTTPTMASRPRVPSLVWPARPLLSLGLYVESFSPRAASFALETPADIIRGTREVELVERLPRPLPLLELLMLPSWAAMRARSRRRPLSSRRLRRSTSPM